MERMFKKYFLICRLLGVLVVLIGNLVVLESVVAVTFYLPEVRPLPAKDGEAKKTAPMEELKKGEKQLPISDKDIPKVLVLISGKAKPKAKISVYKKVFPSVKADGGVMLLKRKDILGRTKSVTANDEGYFELQMTLPTVEVQLPIKVRQKGKKSEKFQINLVVGEKWAKVADEEKLEQNPEHRYKTGLWLGVGANYLSYDQNTSDGAIDVTFESFKAPTIFAKTQYRIDDEWEVSGSYKSSPGEVTSSAQNTISSGAYNWTILSVHGTYFKESWRPKLFGIYKSRLGMIFGLQHHSVPFLAQDSASSALVKENSLTMLALGSKALYDKGRGMAYEIFMRIQIPVASGSVFEVEQKLGFDGSVGLFYNYGAWKVGGFWYGQYHQYGFKHTNYAANAISGNETLLFSTLEARVGYTF